MLSWVGALSLAGCVTGTAAPTERRGEVALDANEVTPIVDEELNRLVEDRAAVRAAIVVLDARDGRILAARGRGPDGHAEARREVTVGSTIKPLTVAAALEAGLDPSREFSGEAGRLVAGEVVLRDVRPSERLDATDVIVRSSNVGAAQIVREIGDAPVAEIFRRAGLLDRAGAVDAGADGAPSASWTVRGTGIGVETNLVRLASIYGSFANGGELIEPTSDGAGARVTLMQAATASAVLDMLEAAVADGGTGRRARVPGRRVAGKTGTVADAVLFAGVTSRDERRYVIVVRAELPGEAWGGEAAAPVFARIARQLPR